ncbi:hypothetical protein CORC01_14224 [Colletotrichum orchidophilum]|uniref:Uncharacterized protein n=1 Tax=Colletotrichum orchidophilum TaxID=1209926 RepID=A0A1G4AN61_9PEZI|nr:uncharacterized protein CORC01_14224 [Colletotrichum orchidophilum]OHE90483.1 hypothetical protein CORC01_14224 [Colletotrichum orchidophilum]
METGEDDHPDLDKKKETWGTEASNIPDAKKCIEQCRAQTLARVIPGFDETSLASVNLIINICQQNVHAPAIKDPGPPPDDFLCAISSDGPLTIQNPVPIFMTDSKEIEPTRTGFKVMATEPSEDMLSTTLSTMKPSTRSTTSETQTPTISIPFANQSQGHRQDGLPMGAKVAIGASSIITFLAIMAFMICLFRRRSREEYNYSLKKEIRHPNPRPDTSPTPLSRNLYAIREGIRTPLTPPPRLQQRRLLSTPRNPERPHINVSIPRTPLDASVETAGGYSPFPISPSSTPTPTTTRLPPEYNRSTKPYYGVPPPSTFDGTGSRSGKTSSMSSAASGRTATTVSNVSSTFPHLTPSWPMRPPRPHEKSLQIPDLVCPGPPPNRSLPPATPGSPASPISFHGKQHQHQHQHRQRGDSFSSVSAAVSNGWVPPRSPARGLVLGKESRDLCDLTEACARESRERSSWGSWSVGGGGTGVGASSIQKVDGRVSSPVIEEADLERMGGRY